MPADQSWGSFSSGARSPWQSINNPRESRNEKRCGSRIGPVPPADSSLDLEEFDLEEERGVRWDHAGDTARTVGLVRRDDEPAHAAGPHPNEPDIPALDDHAPSHA